MAIVDKLELLMHGDLTVTGRLVDASNATLYATLHRGQEMMTCIYKPVAGERPLWDFEDGNLAHREYAAYILSQALGFHIVPMTVLREGPYGFGMVQEWIDIDDSIDLADFFSQDHPQLRQMAIFDAIINNTDRKIGHLLPTKEGALYGCDHGVTFHTDDKLRTVLWQWAGEALTAPELAQLSEALDIFGSDLDLTPYLTRAECDSISARIKRLISKAVMPSPSPDWPAVPWPAF